MTSGGSDEQELGQALALAAREARGGLVEHHQPRLGRARHADLELALLAVRERADRRLQRVGRATRARQRRCARSRCSRSRRRMDRPEPAAVPPDDGEVEVVLDREPGEEPGLLVRPRHAQPRPHAGGQVRHVGAHHLDRAAGGLEVTGDQVEQRRLARAVRAQDCAALTVRDVEIDVAHGLHPAETPADPPQAEDRTGAFGSDGSRRLVQRVRVTRPS